MNGSRYKLLAGAALPCNQNAALLRSDGVDHVKNCADLGTVTDDVVLTGQSAALPCEDSRLLF